MKHPLLSRLSSRLSGAALLSFGVVSLLLACTTSPKATKEDKLCTPGGYVFCRCRDRQEGAKLCKDDAQSFGPCEPCETSDNPEVPLEPGDPGPDEPIPGDDAGPGKDGSNPNGSCGDGVVQSGEDCDDKNTNDTDGCDGNCKLAGTTPGASNACPGLDVHVWGGAHKPTLLSTTIGSGNRSTTPNCTATPNPTTGAAASDRVFKVTAHKTGSLSVVTTDGVALRSGEPVNYNVFLYASDACAPSANTFITCVNVNGGVGGENMTFPVDSGKTYYVFVDGAGISENVGNFRVTFSIP
jgi:cysteine-rich repeat protein